MSERERQEIWQQPARDAGLSRGNLNEAEILASDLERERVSTLLREACVEGRLTLEEFSQRMEQAQAARTRGQLEAITRDLPVSSAQSTIRQQPVSSTVAIMSEAKRQGYWCIGAESKAIAIMGSCKLDLRSVAISSQVTEIDVFVTMGSVEVIVPEGVEVDMNVLVIMGSEKLQLTSPPARPGSPLIRLRGFVLMGEVKVLDLPPLGQRIREHITRALGP